MKQIFIINNSLYDFNHHFDANSLHKTNSQKLYLITNTLGMNVAKDHNMLHFYEKVVDLKNFSEDNIVEFINKHRCSKGDLFVVTKSEDSMPITGVVRKRLGLDTSDYEEFFDKDVMKKKLASSDINKPKYIVFNKDEYLKYPNHYLSVILQKLRFPIFAKPCKMYSSVHLRKITDKASFHDFATNSSSNIVYELDEFIGGTMYHCDSYIQNKTILFTLTSKNSRPCYDFTIGMMKGTIALPEDHPDHTILKRFNENALRSLGMPKSGVTHLEVIKNTNGDLYFIEVAHRPPGCLIPKMYESFANIDITNAHLQLQTNSPFIDRTPSSIYAAWACFPKKPGIVKELNSVKNSYKSNIKISWNINIGDTLKSYSQFGRDYIGTIFMTHHNFDILEEEFYRIHEENLCIIE